MAQVTEERPLSHFRAYHTGLEQRNCGVFRIELWISYPRYRHPHHPHRAATITRRPSYSSQLDFVLKEFQRCLDHHYRFVHINLNDYDIFYRYLLSTPGSTTSTGILLAFTDLTLFKIIVSLRNFLPRDQFFHFHVLDRY